MEPNEEKCDVNPLYLLWNMSSFRDTEERLAQSEKHLFSLSPRVPLQSTLQLTEKVVTSQMFAVFTRRPTNELFESEAVLKCLCCFTVQCCVCLQLKPTESAY